jgi:DNA repair exonuclease SbcCD nuclease subunit
VRIIHTGDIHIGSAFVGLPREKAALRKAEILDGFSSLCAYAKDSGVTAVLIAGDLFDENDVSVQVKNEVFSLMRGAAPVQFFYVSGNHDKRVLLPSELPENVHTFSGTNGFSQYALGGSVTITGADASHFSAAFSSPLSLSGDTFNIVLLHGVTCNQTPQTDEDIPLAYFQNKNVDYLALGHIHKPMLQAEPLDMRGKYRYCGCLEGRGYDETGDRGFFLLDVQNGRLKEEKFLTFSRRKVLQVRVDISRCQTYFDIEKAVLESTRTISKDMLVKVVLCGKYQQGLRKDVTMLLSKLQGMFFHAKIEDESRIYIHPQAFENDITERGEFVREVGRYAMNEDFRAQVLEIGLQALSGEDILL